MTVDKQAAITGALLGGAVGDALGLPYEGLPPRRAVKLLGTPDRYRLFFRWGMISDDTEHALLTAEALARSGGDPALFQHELAGLLRLWLLNLPAGVGLATLRAGLKLVVGVPPERSGVNSAGNGPAMRAAVLGASATNREDLQRWTRLSTRLTHTHPKAEYAALAVAVAAHCQRDGQHAQYLDLLQQVLPANEDATELLNLLKSETLPEFPKGVSGYAYHTVPVAIRLWQQYPHDLMTALQKAIQLGGDTDSLAAITGGIIGAGGLTLPPEWQMSLWEPVFHPSTYADWAQRVTASVNKGTASRRSSRMLWQRWPRNLFFTLVVLTHGFRRLLPPY